MDYEVNQVCKKEFQTFLKSVESKLGDDIWYVGMPNEREWKKWTIRNRGRFIEETELQSYIYDFLVEVMSDAKRNMFSTTNNYHCEYPFTQSLLFPDLDEALRVDDELYGNSQDNIRDELWKIVDLDLGKVTDLDLGRLMRGCLAGLKRDLLVSE